MHELLKDLQAIVGEDSVFADHAARLACASGASFGLSSQDNPLPLACVRPKQLAQVGQILALCARTSTPVRFRGGGTACAPGEGLLILTDALNRIYNIDTSSQWIELEPGVLSQTASAAAARENLYMPGLPLSRDVATVGGVLAHNAVGPDTHKYGFLADRVLALDLWQGSGEKLTLYRAQGIPGYLLPSLPLAAIPCGSDGSLGFIGKVKIKLLPAPKSQIRMLAAGELSNIVKAARMLAELQPAQLYMLDAMAASAIISGSSALLFLELHDDNRENAARQIFADFKLAVATDVDQFLRLRPGVFPGLFSKLGPFHTETCAFSPERLESFVGAALEIAERYAAKVALAGNAAAADVKVAIFASEQKTLLVARELFTLELMLNDSLASEADVSLDRAEWQKRNGGMQAKLCSQLKTIFDPAGIFPPLANLNKDQMPTF